MAADIAQLTQGLTPEQLIASKDENHDVEFYTVSAVFSALATLAVIMRVTSRHMKKVAFGIDDALIVVALIMALVQTVAICIGVRDYGVGRHIWTLTMDQFISFNKLWYSVGFIQCTAQFLTKNSLLILFHRIFITTTFRRGIKVVAIVNLLWWLGTIITDALVCIPASHNWDPSIPAKCANKHLVIIIPPIPWIATDVALLLMPIAMVWKLHLPRLQRIGLAGLFMLGGLSTFASCYRYSLLFFNSEDVTWTLAAPSIWTIIELDVTILTVCLIVSRPWFLKIYPTRLVSFVQTKLATVRRSSSRGGSSGNKRDKPWALFSSFRRLDERPPAVTNVSMGAPFEFDIEKTTHLEVVREGDSE